MTTFKSQFVDDDKEVNEAKHIYKKDKSVDERFREVKYKLALFHLYAPYAKKYFEEGLQLPKECALDFAQVMNENDPFAEFFDEHIEAAADEMVHKKDIERRMEHWKLGKDVPKFSVIKQEFQKRKYVYDSQKRVYNKKTKRIQKGFVIGCRLKDLEYEDEEEDF